MKYRCLASDEVARLLSYMVTDGAKLEGDLATIMDAAQCWEEYLVCHSLFVARHIRADDRGVEKIGMAYELEEAFAFEVQEGGDELVDYMLHHQREPGESLEDALIAIQEGLSSHDYARALRY